MDHIRSSMSMRRAIDSHTPYLERVVQLIPAEIVAVHLALQGLVYNQVTLRDLVIEISAGVLFILLPFYLWRVLGVKTGIQITLTMGSFLVWVLAVSLPVHQRLEVDPLWGSIILILWTTVIPVIAGPTVTESHPNGDGGAESEGKPREVK